MTRKSLRSDESGASLIEFALAAPAMLMFIMGIAQLGMLCMADAGLNSAVAEGARLASVYPTPTDEAILARVNAAAWGMQSDRITAPTIDRDPDDEYLDISMSYSAPLNFAFLELSPVTLSEVRRVYIQGNASSASSGGSSSGSSSSTGGTSAGGTGSTTSASSASSTSSTSTSSTSTGSTSSTSSTSSGSNGNGHGHGHGNGNGNGNGSSGNDNGNGNDG